LGGKVLLWFCPKITVDYRTTRTRGDKGTDVSRQTPKRLRRQVEIKLLAKDARGSKYKKTVHYLFPYIIKGVRSKERTPNEEPIFQTFDCKGFLEEVMRREGGETASEDRLRVTKDRDVRNRLLLRHFLETQRALEYPDDIEPRHFP